MTQPAESEIADYDYDDPSSFSLTQFQQQATQPSFSYSSTLPATLPAFPLSYRQQRRLNDGRFREKSLLCFECGVSFPTPQVSVLHSFLLLSPLCILASLFSLSFFSSRDNLSLLPPLILPFFVFCSSLRFLLSSSSKGTEHQIVTRHSQDPVQIERRRARALEGIPEPPPSRLKKPVRPPSPERLMCYECGAEFYTPQLRYSFLVLREGR